MKRKISKSFFIVAIASTFILGSCKNDSQNSVPRLFEENPATVTWDTSKTDCIDTFAATVSVYDDSNRRAGGAKLREQYKMAVKTVADKQYVRFDFPAKEKVAAKTVMSNGTDTIIVDTKTNQIEKRITASESDLKLINDLGYIISQENFSKIDLSRIKTEATKLALDMSEDKSEKVLSVSLPSKYFSTDKEKRLSTKVSYDTTNELMETVETVTEMEDGSIVTVTTSPVYEEIEDGLIIKIGQYSIIDKKSDIRYEGLEDIEYFESLDDIPELSQDEYEQLVDAGNAVTIEDMPLGDPADPGSIETIIELYDNIEINVIDDSVFKLIMEL